MCTKDRVTMPGIKMLTKTFHPMELTQKDLELPLQVTDRPREVQSELKGRLILMQISSVGSLLSP